MLHMIGAQCVARHVHTIAPGPLLLCSLLYLWGSPFWVRFCVCDSFFQLAREVVTFRLCGRCMLGVISLPSFTCLGGECWDFLNPCDGMHVYTH